MIYLRKNQPVNNALSNYDNEVTPTESGSAGFSASIGSVVNLLTKGESTSLKDLSSKLTTSECWIKHQKYRYL